MRVHPINHQINRFNKSSDKSFKSSDKCQQLKLEIILRVAQWNIETQSLKTH